MLQQKERVDSRTYYTADKLLIPELLFVVDTIAVFGDVMSYGLVEIYLRFGGM